MITTHFKRGTVVAKLLTDLAGNAEPGVRFGFLAHERGIGVLSTVVTIAAAMGLAVSQIHMSMLDKEDMADGAVERRNHERQLGHLGDTVVILTDCDAVSRDTLRDTIEMLRLQDTDRDDEPRALLVLMLTTGPVYTLREMVERATGKLPKPCAVAIVE